MARVGRTFLSDAFDFDLAKLRGCGVGALAREAPEGRPTLAHCFSGGWWN